MAGKQEVRFCRAPDGVRLAYAIHGDGPPLVIASCWLSHLQYDWQSPVWRHFLEDLGARFTVIRYDERGYGLSDWEIGDYSLDSRVADLAAIVESAKLDRFALMGMSQGGPVSVKYAVERPDRVSRLILFGAWACLARTQEDTELLDAARSRRGGRRDPRGLPRATGAAAPALRRVAGEVPGLPGNDQTRCGASNLPDHGRVTNPLRNDRASGVSRR
jgi:pimeloyl-ACP methyl ester carboxylesterase